MRRHLLLIGLGGLSTGAQVLFVREFLTLFAGTELSLGLVFCCWFVGIAAGALIAGRLAPDRHGATTGMLLCCLALPLAAFGLLLLTRCWRLLLTLPAGSLPSIGDLLLAGAAMVTPLALLVGLAFPLACRAVADHERDDLAVGRVYVIESMGAIAGGLAVGVLMAGWLPCFTALLLLSLPLLIAVALYGWPKHAYVSISAGLLAIGLGFCFVLGAAGDVDEISSRWRFDSLQTGDRRIAWAETPYQHLDLAERAGQYNLYADGKIITSFPDVYASLPRAHLVMSQHPAPEQVLYLGSAAAGFLPPALAHRPQSLDLVEPDPALGQLLEPYLAETDRAAQAQPQVKRHLSDARRFMARSNRVWDLIFSDAPDPDTTNLNRVFTREFFEQVKAHLTPDGVFATRISSQATVLESETADRLRSLQATLRMVFEQVLIVPGEETFLFAAKRRGVLLASPQALAKRYRARNPDDGHFSHHQFKLLVQADRIEDLKNQLLSAKPVTPNSDLRPVAMLHSVLAWSRLRDDAAARPLRALMALPAWAWFAGVCLLMVGLCSLGLQRATRRGRQAVRRMAALAVFVIGGLGMAMELVLSYAYQAVAGSLYQEIGLIVATFMGGLVLGGIWIQSRLARLPGNNRSLGWVLIGLAASTALIGILQTWDPLAGMGPVWQQALLLLQLLVVGAGTGIAFPLAGQIVVRSGAPVGRTAGWLDGLDHLGAAMGALFAGLILVPVLGRDVTCGLLATACALAGGMNLMVSRLEDKSKKRELGT